MFKAFFLVATGAMVGWCISTESYGLAAVNAASFFIILATKD